MFRTVSRAAIASRTGLVHFEPPSLPATLGARRTLSGPLWDPVWTGFFSTVLCPASPKPFYINRLRKTRSRAKFFFSRPAAAIRRKLRNEPTPRPRHQNASLCIILNAAQSATSTPTSIAPTTYVQEALATSARVLQRLQSPRREVAMESNAPRLTTGARSFSCSDSLHDRPATSSPRPRSPPGSAARAAPRSTCSPSADRRPRSPSPGSPSC